MKTASERMRERMRPERVMTSISLRIPERVIEDLKEIAPMLGMTGYQSLIKLLYQPGFAKGFRRNSRARMWLCWRRVCENAG